MSEGKIVEYCMVAALDPGKQTIEVNKLLEEGYELYGFPTSYPSGEHCIFAQAVVKREVDGVEWISFTEFRKNLKKRFEEETGWDESKVGKIEFLPDFNLYLDYKGAYTAWLEIQLAMPQRVKDVPEIEKGEDDGCSVN